jgi:hypothetical protein
MQRLFAWQGLGLGEESMVQETKKLQRLLP